MMRGLACGRQWVLVVCICLGLLTLFTANGHPFRELDAGNGINDDPAESQSLSLSERDASQPDIKNIFNGIAVVKNLTANNSSSTTAPASSKPTAAGLNKTSTTPRIPENSTLDTNANRTGQNASKTNVTTMSQSVSIKYIATTTGNIFSSTTIQNSSVNMKINPSQSIKIVPKSSNGIKLSTSTNLLKPSATQLPPTGSHKSRIVSSVGLSITLSLASSHTRSLASSYTAVLPINVSAKSSVVANLNPNRSTINVKPTIGVISALKSSAKAVSSSPSRVQNAPSQKATPVPSSTMVKPSAVPSLQKSLSSMVPTTQKSTGSSSSIDATEVPSTTGKKLSSTHTTPKGSTSQSTKPSTQTSTSKQPSTSKQQSTKIPSSTRKTSTKKPTTVLSTSGQASLPPTTEVTTPLDTSTVASTKKPSTKMLTTNLATKPVTIHVNEKPITKASLAAVSSSGAPSTVPKKPTTIVKPETTKKATTKEAVTTKKTTAENTQTKNENNDAPKGQMPVPDQGREAVLWDFIVPVAIGTAVALAIAFGVILVRTCRRRRLIKVRFGGKPSHPRLLNNDLINLLAESDDEEE